MVYDPYGTSASMGLLTGGVLPPAPPPAAPGFGAMAGQLATDPFTYLAFAGGGGGGGAAGRPIAPPASTRFGQTAQYLLGRNDAILNPLVQSKNPLSQRAGKFLTGKGKYVGRLGLGVGLGVAASPVENLLNQLDESGFAGDVAGTAMQGAALGSIAGPWGTLAGGAGGALLGALRGDRNVDVEKEALGQVRKEFAAYGIPRQQVDRLMQIYDDLAEANPQYAAEWLASAMGQAQEQWAGSAGNILGGGAGAGGIPSDLVLQQMAGDVMRPYVESMQANTQAATDSLLAGLQSPYVSDSFRAAATSTLGQYNALQKNIADSYAIQAMAFPTLNRLAESQWAAFQGQQSGAGGSGSFNDLLNDLVASGSVETRAMGGPVNPGVPTLVGEQGPELLMQQGDNLSIMPIPIPMPSEGLDVGKSRQGRYADISEIMQREFGDVIPASWAPSGPGHIAFDPDVTLDPSQVRDIRGRSRQTNRAARVKASNPTPKGKSVGGGKRVY